MKHFAGLMVTVLLVSLSAIPAMAAETNETEKEKVAYLGIATSRVSDVLREQLELPKGVGLVIDYVDADSPARSSGLKKYDILQKLNDQILINPDQLAVLVRMFKAGEEIDLTLIRQGKAMSVPAKLAKLVEKELLPVLSQSGWRGPRGEWFRAFKTYDKALKRLDKPFGDILLKQIMKESDTNDEIGSMLRGYHWKGPKSFSLMYLYDGDRSYEVRARHDGSKTIVVSDKDGNVVFKGPVDTETQREQLPEHIRTILDDLD